MDGTTSVLDAPMPSGAGPVRVLGVDGVGDRLADLAGEEAAAVGVDVPIGLVEAGWREADLDARRLLGNLRSSLFMTPPRAAVRAQTFEAALATCRERTGGVGLSIQAFGFFPGTDWPRVVRSPCPASRGSPPARQVASGCDRPGRRSAASGNAPAECRRGHRLPGLEHEPATGRVEQQLGVGERVAVDDEQVGHGPLGNPPDLGQAERGR
jgi:hypothetical protein